MTEPIILSKSKREVKRIFFFSIIALIISIIAVMFIPVDFTTRFFIGLAELAYFVQLMKIPRFWFALRSNDLELVSNKLTGGSFERQTAFPFKMSSIIIVILAFIYFLSAVMQVEIYKILLCINIIPMIYSGARKVIMFDYQHGYFYGLWETKSFYDSDRQKMKGIKVEYVNGESGIEKIKLIDKSGYYFIHKGKFSPSVWSAILHNLDRIVSMNQIDQDVTKHSSQ